jgi:hypothetical protein
MNRLLTSSKNLDGKQHQDFITREEFIAILDRTGATNQKRRTKMAINDPARFWGFFCPITWPKTTVPKLPFNLLLHTGKYDFKRLYINCHII